MSTPLQNPTQESSPTTFSRPPTNSDIHRSWQALDNMSPIDRARHVRSMTSEEKNLLSPRSFLGMRGLSSSHSPTTRIKQLFFSVGNVANAAIGSGILAFPRAFMLSGWALGLIFTFVAAAMNTYTLLIVLRTARLHGCNSYPATISKLYGSRARRVIELSVFIFSLSCNLSYLLVVGDMVSATFFAVMGSTSGWTSPYAVTVVGWLAVTPLCFFKSLDFLGPISLVGVVAVVVVVCVIVMTSLNSKVKPPLDTLVAFNFQPCAIQSLPIIFFALMCHLTIVPCGIELGEYWPSLRTSSTSSRVASPSGSRHGSRQGANGSGEKTGTGTGTLNESLLTEEGNTTTSSDDDSTAAPRIKPRFRTLIVMTSMVMMLCWLMYSAVGASGYLLFGESTKANVINSFGKKIQGGTGIQPVTVVVVISQVCMAISTLLGYPTMLYIARQTLFELVGEMRHGSPSYNATTISMQCVMLVLAIAIRWAGLDISFVISLIGSTAGATLQFVLPACMLITLGMPCKGFLFMIFGILFGVLGTAITIMSAVCESESHSTSSGGGNIEPDWCVTMGF